ncbi:dihydrolipoyl dehydrogenase [Paenibacillus mucilaginosus]|uniref:Dihydrolipoyl dehydrogenase n=2 Tax=Paenibacillus mucilaginosus TaxID=61624 RepID=I0BHZ5_9BACL|nr:dihydrolipoyl dehydrogenase [Paenibacillus mucilaginosus]AEI41254.1 BfmBC [Paenibacillus mucilaginosus KNP414]AFH61992.1 dihydrolipoamide dehydrogenase [Paenibacillus mucilaginosus K02]MCG7211323.1 dihydrolipoyl dehydrogenase [Paenibacillus mucilaginosus]WDM30287.1 dihydrolipoyl dehydrogenase [Paenibacillus mucilaginosus]WFA18473.1 dihydrolipoyl dehydrogenase [Paenibacillus mucilaginosus]
MSQNFDVVVLGGGVGGYSAAIRAAQLGKSVAIVEEDKLGGTCLHRGCIPSKALLRSAEVYALMKESARFGIETGETRLNFPQVLSRKNEVVESLHTGLQFLMRKHKIQVFYGKGRVIGPSIFSPRSGAVSVEQADGEILSLVPEALILATGSRPRVLPGLEPDGVTVLSSDDALRMEELPASMLIIGGGVIGVEWASMLSDFGVKVTIAEVGPRLVPGEEEEISRELERLLRKRGVTIHTGCTVLPETCRKQEGGLSIEAEQRGERIRLEAGAALVSVGRGANVEGIGLENTDVKIEGGYIRVNASMQTAEHHIYAVGDCTGGVQLAHAAGHEGIAAAEHICRQETHRYEPHRIPRCVYSRPEIASVGWTEAQAKERGHEVKTSKVHFQALGKALVLGETDGFVKVVADARTNDILGVHMIGAHVTDYISEAVLAQLLEAAPWEVGTAMHPHPTLSEILGEAMLAVDGRAITM